MRVRNIHERIITASTEQLGALLDTLASSNDQIWPRERWPAMRFDRPLGKGAVGGHGPIRYFIANYRPGRSILFTFTGPQGFQGQHGFEIERVDDQHSLLRHRLEMVADGKARFSWPLAFRPLHDALIEDALDKAELQLGHTPTPRTWSPWVHILRRALSRRRRGTHGR